jgi:16S rRNA processing protein RimM
MFGLLSQPVMSQREASFISIARITKTQGLKGEVRVEQMLADDRVFQGGRLVTVFANAFAGRKTEIEFFRRQHGRCVLKLRGIDTIEDAEKIIGAEVRIPADELPEPEEGSFYTFQLKGCEVFTVDGEHVGTVIDVLDSGGTEILKVDRGEEETLIPFAHAFLKKIDVEGRRIEVDLPEGLRELNK